MSRLKAPPLGRAILYGLLGTWFVATVAAQDPRRKFERLRRYDPTGAFIPDWRFFAPRPAMHDYHLLMRDELADGELTEWLEVFEVEQRCLRHMVWYPGRRGEKVLSDAVSGIIAFSQVKDRRPEDTQLSMAYLTLLNYVTIKVNHVEGTRRTQFLIGISAGYEEKEDPAMMFLSNLHPVPKADVLAPIGPPTRRQSAIHPA